jgi:hypothetical protein
MPPAPATKKKVTPADKTRAAKTLAAARKPAAAPKKAAAPKVLRTTQTKKTVGKKLFVLSSSSKKLLQSLLRALQRFSGSQLLTPPAPVTRPAGR